MRGMNASEYAFPIGSSSLWSAALDSILRFNLNVFWRNGHPVTRMHYQRV
jgi:hypothetical protein